MVRKPCASRYSQRWEPRKPAPPVTTAVGITASYRPSWADPAASREPYEVLTPSSGLSLVDHDRAAGDRLRISRVHVEVRVRDPVVEHDVAVVVQRDPDPELVDAAAAVDVTVVGGEGEVVAGDAVDAAAALVLGLVTGDDEPVVDV